MMTLAIVCGGLFGVGLLWLIVQLAPPRQDLAVEIGRWESARHNVTETPILAGYGFKERVGRWITRQMVKRGIETPQTHADLAITGKHLETHVTQTLLTVLVAIVGSAALGTLAAMADIEMSAAVPFVAATALSVLVVIVSWAGLHKDAERKRDELRRALGTYFDLVSMSLAGGRGIPEALPTSAAIGTGWAFDLISDTINQAWRAGETPWRALGDLGERVGLRELVDLSASLTLVGDSGAKVRGSLAQRASTLRTRELADIQASAEMANSTMLMAQVGFLLGFLLLIAYPAATAIMSS